MGNSMSRTNDPKVKQKTYQVRILRINQDQVDTVMVKFIENMELPVELFNEARRTNVTLTTEEFKHPTKSDVKFKVFKGLKNAQNPLINTIFIAQFQVSQIVHNQTLYVHETPTNFDANDPHIYSKYIQKAPQEQQPFNPQKHMEQLIGRPNVPYIDTGAHYQPPNPPPTQSHSQQPFRPPSAYGISQQPYYQQTLSR